ncbi:MAG: ribosome biogenesis GTPase Der, partial [Thiotrichales bacterium]|nr:ribosome biogenesis GTPase Der [Thiotrichales bacterium]MBT7439329.1 ribosome biogenesis GTPase Der [Thiotrichales bacterium]MBT7934165.1 ribosome biogenesis GTPase Der [Thiotrichales bacterium]
GKSTLFNRLSNSRQALVSDFEGLTRDRQYANIELENGIYCSIVDTGGLTNENSIIDTGIHSQVINALNESDVIYFIVSNKDGVTSLDLDISAQLRKLKKNIVLVCNKAEGLNKTAASEFYELGLGDPTLISAEHNQGIPGLIEKTIPLLPEAVKVEKPELDGIAVAVLGRPNVGKSTLINRILGEERVMAVDLPGTTRDSIFIPFEREGQQYTLIDTAGIRRKRSVSEKVEIFSIIKAKDAINESHVVILVLDAHEGVTEQDATLLGLIADKGRALLIVINKWDGLDDYQKSEVKRKLDIKLSFVNYATVHFISALHGSGVGKLFSPIKKSYENAGGRFPTSLLNRILEQANNTHRPPPVAGKRMRLKFVNQSDIFPPTLIFHGNHVQNVPNSYERFLKNFFITALKLTNTPIKIQYKSGDNPFKDKKNILSARQIQKKKRLMKFVKKK